MSKLAAGRGEGACHFVCIQRIGKVSGVQFKAKSLSTPPFRFRFPPHMFPSSFYGNSVAIQYVRIGPLPLFRKGICNWIRAAVDDRTEMFSLRADKVPDDC